MRLKAWWVPERLVGENSLCAIVGSIALIIVAVPVGIVMTGWRRLFVFFLLWICASPAFADSYLMYPPGQTRAAHIWNGPEPIPGEHCPSDWKVVKWDIDKSGDTEPRNYLFDGDKQLTYDKPAPPDPLPPGPDPNKFEQAIRDGIANDTISANAVSFTGQLAKERDDTKRQQIWSKIKASGLLWLNPANVSAIETAASDNNMPLK